MRISRTLVTAGAAAAVVVALTGQSAGARQSTSPQGSNQGRPMHINCANGRFACTEVAESERAFGKDVYVGHDEPSLLFYSNKPGSGNRMRYEYQLPKDPPAKPINGRSYNFQLGIASWFGMALCDTQSYPEQVRNCTPNSDSNIVDPRKSPKHPGSAYMELQFYPPGWVPFQFATSCSATEWCAAMAIFSLDLNPVSGRSNNTDCLTSVGIEPANFAFITRNGKPHGPPSPLQGTAATFTPNRSRDLFMASGHKITISMHDTAHGLRAELRDNTSGQSGFMTASAENGFAQVKFDPAAKKCSQAPYDFHPMYSTSSEKTTVPWAAHTYNIAFDDEIGHFDYCTKIDQEGGKCIGREGVWGDREKADGDNTGCFTPALSFLVKVTGCIGTNTGFDGVSYQPLWPDGNAYLHPTPQLFSSPLTGARYDTNYSRVAFEADLPRIEAADFGGRCDRDTGKGCTRIPVTDDGLKSRFYPFFSSGSAPAGCRWTIGNDVGGFTTRDYGRNAQYGELLKSFYTGTGGGAFSRYNNFRKVLSDNPCKA